jgi:hypothetical protein
MGCRDLLCWSWAAAVGERLTEHAYGRSVVMAFVLAKHRCGMPLLGQPGAGGVGGDAEDVHVAGAGTR